MNDFVFQSPTRFVFGCGYADAKRGDYRFALEWFKPLAEEGSVEAQYNCGLLYEKMGELGKASEWYITASVNGSESAKEALEHL